jgi:hypothetical protein
MSARTILVPVDDSDVRFVGLGEGEGRVDAAFLASSFTATSPLFSSSFDLSLDLFDSTRLSSFFLTTTTGPFSPSLRFSPLPTTHTHKTQGSTKAVKWTLEQLARPGEKEGLEREKERE